MHDDLLSARETRSKTIDSWLKQGHSCLVSIRANIPGEHKNISEAYVIVRFFESLIRKKYTIVKHERFTSNDGPYTLISLDESDYRKVKLELIELEESEALGRLVDLDLWTAPDQLWSRDSVQMKPRTCFICGDIAHHCIRSLKHSLDETLAFVQRITQEHLEKQMSILTKKAMMIELNLEDKFGLVTPSSTGSHDDMDYHLMIRAQRVIIPYFVEMFRLGYGDFEIYNLFDLARPLGVKAEQAMLDETGGVNCYKGLIFILGLILTSLGYTLKHQQDFNHVFTNIHQLTQHLFDDFEQEPKSFGEKAFHEHRITGARGEAYLGLPSVHHALHVIGNKTLTDELLRIILQQIIRSTDDTVLLKRAGSFEAYTAIKKKVASLDVTQINQVKEFTREAIHQGLSFGGAADLLVATIFLHEIEQTYF